MPWGVAGRTEEKWIVFLTKTAKFFSTCVFQLRVELILTLSVVTNSNKIICKKVCSTTESNFLSVFSPQYNLDFNVLFPSNRGGNGQFRDNDDGSGAGGVGTDGKMNSGAGSDGSMWQFGMARRGKKDGSRTRVSFLLFWVIRKTEERRKHSTVYPCVFLWANFREIDVYFYVL